MPIDDKKWTRATNVIVNIAYNPSTDSSHSIFITLNNRTLNSMKIRTDVMKILNVGEKYSWIWEAKERPVAQKCWPL